MINAIKMKINRSVTMISITGDKYIANQSKKKVSATGK